MTHTITIADVETDMIIETEEGDRVAVDMVFNQGEGLGIVVKGLRIDNGRPFERRFLDTSEMVERIQSETNGG